MEITLVSFADERMSISQDKLIESGRKFGIEKFEVWTERALPQYFIDDNKEVFSNSFGAGFYIWKPFVIWQSILKMKDGEILLYCDSGVELVDSVIPVINSMTDDIFLFGNGWPMRDWTKMDILKRIAPNVDWYSEESAKYHQVQASCMLFRVSKRSRDFIKTWLLYCQMPGFCDNSESIFPNVPTFRENRWDQSVLGALQLSMGLPLHFYACLTGRHLQWLHPDDKYPLFLNHHRRRNDEWV